MDTLSNGLSRLTDAANGVIASVSNTVADASSDVGSQIQDLAASVASKVRLGATPVPVSQPPSSPLNAAWDKLTRHKRIAALLGSVAVGAAAYGAYSAWCLHLEANSTQGQRRRKRLARRAADGGRAEVVVVVGSPQEPLIRILASDLNIRGFIVYMTVMSPEDEECVRREKSGDIRSLKIANIDDQESIAQSLGALSRLLETPVASFAGGTPRYLSLSGVIIVPDLYYPSGPLEATSVALWQHTVHAKIQIPLNILTSGMLDIVRQHASKLVLITPSIIGSLNPAFHIAESMCVSALSALALALSRELAGQRIAFTHMRLGSFDTHHIIGGTASSAMAQPASTEYQVAKNMRADVLGWPERVRRLYAAPYTASAYLQMNRTRGSKIRQLHHALYDVISSTSPPRVVHVGRGSYAYSLLAAIIPESVMTVILATPSVA